VDARAQGPTETPHYRVDQGPRQIPESEEEHRNQDRPPCQPSREVGELDLQHLGRKALGPEEWEPEHFRVTSRLTRLLARGRRHHGIDLEVACVGEVDHQHGEIPGQRDDAIPRSEIERIQRHIPHIAEAQGDEVPLPPEHVLHPAHAPRDDGLLQRQFEPDEPVQARQLGDPGDPNVGGSPRSSRGPALSDKRNKRGFAQRSQPGAGPHFRSTPRRQAQGAVLFDREA